MSTRYPPLIAVSVKIMSCARLRDSDPDHGADGVEPERPQQARELGFLLAHPDVVTEAIAPGHRRPRLIGIELPGVEIEDDRPVLGDVDPPDAAADQREGRQPEVAAASDREVHAEHANGTDRDLHEVARPLPPQLVRKTRRRVIAVAVVAYRIDARVVAESFLEQDVVRPGLVPPDREVGRAVTQDGLLGQILEHGLGLFDVLLELRGGQPRDRLVTMTVTRDLVSLPLDGADHRWMRRRDLAQHEERRLRAGAGHQGQDALDARLDA